MASIAGAAATAGIPVPALSERDTAPTAGFRPISPQPAPAGETIELIEFFWYGCPYCAQLQPYLTRWLGGQPHVLLRRVPAVFRPSWTPHARLYYTLEKLGAVERLHQQVFDSYHLQGMTLDSADATADWASRHGVERERWLAAYQADDIDRLIEDARAALVRYTVSGTPSLVVDGRFLTSSGMTPGVAAMIPVLDVLVARVRQERAPR